MVPYLAIQGRIYVPIHEAAKDAGLSQTYIGRLARTGVLTGQIIGGMWFLDRGHLRAFLAQRAKNGSVKP
jgi:hypothetical protein